MNVYLVKETGVPTPVVVLADKVEQRVGSGQILFTTIHEDENEVVTEEGVYGAAHGAWRTWRWIREINNDD